MSVVSDHDERSLDEKRLGRAVRDAGEYTNGIVAVEVWMLDEETGKLERPPSGWWRDESLASAMAKSPEERDALCTFEEATHPDFVPVGAVPPGVDIAGELWVEAKSFMSTTTLRDKISTEMKRLFSPPKRPGEECETNNSVRSTRSQDTHRRTLSGNVLNTSRLMSSSAFSQSYDSRSRFGIPPYGISRAFTVQDCAPSSPAGSLHNGQQIHGGAILWRDIHSLVVDPDTAKTPRLAHLEKAGLRHAA
eukprot:4095701-Ditylum_brightwellii.AAC.1